MSRTPEERLLNPRPGSKIAEARDYGIDLTLLVENLRLSVFERIRQNDQTVTDLRRFRKATQSAKKQGITADK